ncbi:MAG: DUF4145 domain-containing protein, partial [Verrucomicrobia bacterium]|nr:DUF4145 domain-containing protein [Deltaproteobacteria bacterium]
MSNFTFLQQDWPELYETARESEQNVNSAPRTSSFYARRSLERAVKWLYANDSYLKQPYADNLAALIHEPSFRENLEPCLFPKILTIQKIGNLAVHSDKPISSSDSLHTLKELFHVLYWLARSYSPTAATIGKPLFDITRIPQKDSAVADRNAEQLAKLQAEQADKDTRLAAKDAELARTIEEIAALKARIQEYKERNSQTPDDHDYSEAETRDYFIDLLLKESGWGLKAPDVLEYPVTGMPNDKGESFVDYVLWGDDGLPLAVVEAKRTRKDSRIGQQQAKLYADCLERMKGQRPIIFFTNGYETWLWDDLNYPPRKVQGFYKKDELQLLINRRTSIREITGATINKAIVERYYQHEAIRRTTEDFQRRKLRKALLVSQESLGKKIFKQRLNLLLLLQQPDIPAGDGLQRLRGSIEDVLHGEVTLMNPDNFIVRPHRRHLEKYSVREQWNKLNAEDALEVTLHLAGLPAELPQEDETTKRFDLLLLNLQLALLEKSASFARYRDKVMEISARLEGKGTIPMVAQQMELILDLQTESWWAGIT